MVHQAWASEENYTLLLYRILGAYVLWLPSSSGIRQSRRQTRTPRLAVV